MGGSAFSSGANPLRTPRMPPHVYHEMKRRLHNKLRDIFVAVATPIEGPAKSSFGDIDFAVALEKRVVFPGSITMQHNENNDENILLAVQNLLGSERAIVPKGQLSANMAIPWPEDLLPPPEEPTSSHAEAGQEASDTTIDRLYIQVDVQIHPSVSALQWNLFKHAHGDIWNLMGSAIRPLGLTVDENALWLRIPEIEAANRNRAKVFLSDEPCDILRFLGLGEVTLSEAGEEKRRSWWEESFTSLEEMFEYVASSRLFYIFPLPEEKKEEEQQQAHTRDDCGTRNAPNDNSSTTDGRPNLKHNDRKRMKSRPVFAAWIDDFMPRARERNLYSPPPGLQTRQQLREQVRADAFVRWPASAAVYASRLAAWVEETSLALVWSVGIKGTVPPARTTTTKPTSTITSEEGGEKAVEDEEGGEGLEPYWRGACCSALKKIILQGDASYGGIVPAPGSLHKPRAEWREVGRHDGDRGEWDIDAVQTFVRNNWREVGRIAAEKQAGKYRAKIALSGGWEAWQEEKMRRRSPTTASPTDGGKEVGVVVDVAAGTQDAGGAATVAAGDQSHDEQTLINLPLRGAS